MKQPEFLDNLTPEQLEKLFLTLGVYFNKNAKIGESDEAFAELEARGRHILSILSINLPDKTDYTPKQLMDLIKVKLWVKGFELN